MARPESRPSTVDALIADYGRFLGIADLAFDGDGLIGLAFEAAELTLQWRAAAGGIVVKSPLPVPRTLPTGILAVLHATNARAVVAGMGMVAIDADVGAWVWIDRIDPAGLTATGLHGRLERAARGLAFWKGELPALIRSAEAAPAAATETGFDISMIRV